MAHAYKKTLLAQLGFADADKQNPRHDLAVEYLALPHNSQRLIQGLYKTMTWEAQVTEKEPFGPDSLDPDGWRWQRKQLHSLRRPERERPLTKGKDQYKTTVGFLDLFLHYEESDNRLIQYKGDDQPQIERDYAHNKQTFGFKMNHTRSVVGCTEVEFLNLCKRAYWKARESWQKEGVR